MIAYIGHNIKYTSIIQKIVERIDDNIELHDNFNTINEIAEKFKNATHYSQLIIDIDYLQNNKDDEIVNAISIIRLLSPVNTILMVQEPRVELLKKLVENDFYNFVDATTEKSIQEQLSQCINPGRTKNDVSVYVEVKEELEKRKKKPKFSLPIIKREKSITADETEPTFEPEEPIIQSVTTQPHTVAVVGTYPRIGTTTQAIRVARYFAKINPSCYVEKNKSGYIHILNNVLSDTLATVDNTCVVHQDATMFTYGTPEVNLQHYITIVYDFGVYDDMNRNEILSCDIILICSGSAPWEMLELSKVLPIISKQNNDYYIFSFSDESEHKDILDFMGDKWKRTLFAPYSPDMFSAFKLKDQETYQALHQKTYVIRLLVNYHNDQSYN